MNAKRFVKANAKRYVNKGTIKRAAAGAVEQQIKVLMAAVSTILIHKVIQYLAGKYPKLSFLRMAEDRAMRV